MSSVAAKADLKATVERIVPLEFRADLSSAIARYVAAIVREERAKASATLAARLKSQRDLHDISNRIRDIAYGRAATS